MGLVALPAGSPRVHARITERCSKEGAIMTVEEFLAYLFGWPTTPDLAVRVAYASEQHTARLASTLLRS